MPQNVGIFAIEMYFPKLYLEQTELELYDNCVGKYTKGLGLKQMGVATNYEDTASMALTACKKLMDNYAMHQGFCGSLTSVLNRFFFTTSGLPPRNFNFFVSCQKIS